MDYAEVFRRRTNIVAPAIHAATLQVSPVAADGGDVEGGTFGAHAGGLAHYRAPGYKTRARPAPAIVTGSIVSIQLKVQWLPFRGQVKMIGVQAT